MTTGVKVYIAYNITTMLTDWTEPNKQGKRLNTQLIFEGHTYTTVLCYFLSVYYYKRAIDKLLKSFIYCLKLFHILNNDMRGSSYISIQTGYQ